MAINMRFCDGIGIGRDFNGGYTDKLMLLLLVGGYFRGG